MENADKADLTELTAAIVGAYVSHNAVQSGELPALIASVHQSLGALGGGTAGEAPAEPQKPAVSVRKSVTEDYLICLEDGRKFTSLKRHLRTAYGLSPEQYRAKWNLPSDYPMVAPAYAAKRSALAKASGLGLQAKKRVTGRKRRAS